MPLVGLICESTVPTPDPAFVALRTESRLTGAPARAAFLLRLAALPFDFAGAGGGEGEGEPLAPPPLAFLIASPCVSIHSFHASSLMCIMLRIRESRSMPFARAQELTWSNRGGKVFFWSTLKQRGQVNEGAWMSGRAAAEAGGEEDAAAVVASVAVGGRSGVNKLAVAGCADDPAGAAAAAAVAVLELALE